jgi:glucan 1,3-beta-glucosidase
MSGTRFSFRDERRRHRPKRDSERQLPETLRGVNLGGWLVLERWLTPSVFAGTTAEDEFTLMAEPDAAERLRRHRESFITAGDFAWIAEQGLDLVRLPVGYWVLDGDPPFLAAAEPLDRAMDLAAEHGLRVLLDVHAGPGSQNGLDSSGRIGAKLWYRSADHRDHTVRCLVSLVRRYRDHPALWGIELINEPIDWRVWRLWRFHRAAFGALLPLLRSGTYVVFSDGYLPRLLRGSLRRRGDVPVAMDCHFYQCFNARDTSRSVADVLRKAAGRRRLIRWLSRAHPVLVGEWSAALDARTFRRTAPDRRSAVTGQFLRAQLEGYQDALGWCYWTYTSENRDDWNLRHLVESGMLRLRPGD